MKKIFLFIVAAFFFQAISFAQKSGTEIKGDTYFGLYSFEKAIEKYTEVDGLSNDGFRNLAESYKNTNQDSLSANTYREFIETVDAKPEDIFNYASVLRLQGEYEKSDKWMQKFQKAAPGDHRGQNYVSKASELEDISTDKGVFSVMHLDINTSQQDFGPSYYGTDKIVFASSREGVKTVKRNYNWNGMPFLDIYAADITDVQLTNPSQLNKKTNKKMHEGPVSFNIGGTFMAFTRNNYEGKSEDGTVKLKLFFSSKDEEGKWSEPEAFKLNSDEYSVGHASLNHDGTVMYFASDMPGGNGGVDIYRIEKSGDGTWGKEVNLGSDLNTEGNEMFPFYQEEKGLLFFASNGHMGLGGLDIFVSKNNDGNFSKVMNIGAPMNTQSDDFSLIIDKDMKTGYFASNREGGNGDDDIYSFKMLKELAFGKIIKGTATDKNGEILANTEVVLLDSNGNGVGTVTTSDNGKYRFSVDADQNFVLLGSKDKYYDGDNTADTHTEKTVIIADLVLEKDPGLSLYCLVNDKDGNPIDAVTVSLKNLRTGTVETFTTSKTGDFIKPITDAKLQDELIYEVTYSKDGYISETRPYSQVLTKEGQYNLFTGDAMALTKLEVGMDIGKLVDINPIYFDFNKFYIRPDAKVELDKIVKVMNDYPTMEIELGSHTDCRGSKSYNEWLSDERAKASAKYIKSKITNPNRIYGKGYGEYKVINKCECEGSKVVPCTEDEHQENRRTEFKVISMGGANVKNTSPDSFEK